ncbi:MAG: (5-formylfuran-3-yl)methyl phosphate synthase [Pirellulales bacterium]
MTGLLVSVRDADEARLALAAGVDVIDVKEPSRGSLGAASMTTIRGVVDAVAGRAVVSAACGELLDAFGLDSAHDGMPHGGELNGVAAAKIDTAKIDTAKIDLAKIGLAGCDAHGDWPRLWRRWAKTLPQGVRPVAVAYADRHLARSPPWENIVALAAEAHAPYVLVDTFDKRAGMLFDHWTRATLAAFAERARASGVGFVLAGSLRREDIGRVREFRPDFVAVRGAACRGGRCGALDPAAIEQLLVALGRQPASAE